MRQPLQLQILKPCHEKWYEMTPQQQGPFCGSCQKTVVDFSSMTGSALLDYFKNFKGDTCGRFELSQAVGFESVEKKLTIAEANQAHEVCLTFKPYTGEVIVTGYESVKGRIVLGGVSTVKAQHMGGTQRAITGEPSTPGHCISQSCQRRFKGLPVI